jgi:hypothetical protein
LSHEDRELEVARQVVRLGAAAMSRAARAPRNAPPQLVARRAFTSAARTYAPGLLRRRPHCAGCTAAARRGGAGYGRKGRPGSSQTGGGRTFVRRSNGTRAVSGVAGPSYVESSPDAAIEGGHVEAGAAQGDPGHAAPGDGALGYAPDGYPTSSRGGRWFRRGRHIVLTGL